MATPQWFARCDERQKKAILATKTADELTSYLRQERIDVPEPDLIEMVGAVNLGRSFGVWLKQFLGLDGGSRSDTAKVTRGRS